MIQYQLKLLCLTGVWNWAVRKIKLDARDKIYYSPRDFQNLLFGHGQKIGIPSHTIQGMLSTAYAAWTRCFEKLAKASRLKGQRNRLNSVPFPDPLCRPEGNRISIPGLSSVRFPKQQLPEGKLKCGRVVRRASGWYLCLIIDAEPKAIPHVADGSIGINPGFRDLLTLSTGEEVEHPRELKRLENRLVQAQRGGNRRLTARLHERIKNQRKDRNHKLSRRLVSENEKIVFS